MRKIFLALILIGCCAGFINAQTTVDDDDNQSWNDVQLTVPMTKEFDFFTQITARFGNNVSRLVDSRFALGFVWKPTKSLSVSPFYLNIEARNARGRFRQENRLNLRATYRFPTKGFGLSHRSLYEYRIRRPRNSWRYRPSLTFEKDIPKKIIPGAKVFVTEEVFYDSLLDKFSRNRFTVGINKTINKKLSLDVYYMRQNDGFSVPGDLNVIGTTWRVKL
ncbi:MAG TPA: DUF2490 domain-containing protein [Pyrinomonadaceae bacterium]|nr:DUF2490 domain-containing protein [Pyrinomonadaceae bacterium]